MNRTLPTIAMLLGIAGLIPFFVCGLAALAGVPPNSERALLAFNGYGAVILGFLGGVHWGFGLDPTGSPPSDVQRARFGLGVLPALIGWVALLITFLGFELTAVLVLAVGFIVTTITEGRAARV